jgi:hypothetical protein
MLLTRAFGNVLGLRRFNIVTMEMTWKVGDEWIKIVVIRPTFLPEMVLQRDSVCQKDIESRLFGENVPRLGPFAMRNLN